MRLRVLNKRTGIMLCLTAYVIVLLGGLLYFFEWRPAEIRKRCFDDSMSGILKDNDVKLEVKELTGEQVNNLYRLCLVSNGMQAEDLFKVKE